MIELRTGDTLRVTDPAGTYDSHLWIVVSKPELDGDNVLIVNLTSWRADKDQACVLDVGDHPYIRKRTCINYPGSKIVAASHLNLLINSGDLEKHVPVDMGLLDRIREGAMLSRHMPLDKAQSLIDQGLVALDDF